MAKVRVIANIRIELDTPNIWHARDEEHRAKQIEDWTREFNEFIRDHRSQDAVLARVIRDYEDQCSHCGNTWEVDEDGPLCCTKAQVEWNADEAARAAVAAILKSKEQT